MGSIDMSYFLNMSPARLMIKIWEFSHHVHHIPALDPIVVIANIIWSVVSILLERSGTTKTTFILIVPFTSFNFIEKDMCV